MTEQTLQEDLAYIRDLAEAGQSAPLLGGRFMVWWGGLTSLAYAAHYLILSGLAGIDPQALAWLWSGFGVIGLAGFFLLLRSMPRDKPGMSSTGNKVEGEVWKIGGYALFAYFIALMLKAFSGAGAEGFTYSLPVVFALYAVGLYTSGTLANNQTLRRASLAALGVLALAVWFQATQFIWAIAALGVFLTVFVPGLILMRNEPKSLV